MSHTRAARTSTAILLQKLGVAVLDYFCLLKVGSYTYVLIFIQVVCCVKACWVTGDTSNRAKSKNSRCGIIYCCVFSSCYWQIPFSVLFIFRWKTSMLICINSQRKRKEILRPITLFISNFRVNALVSRLGWMFTETVDIHECLQRRLRLEGHSWRLGAIHDTLAVTVTIAAVPTSCK